MYSFPGGTVVKNLPANIEEKRHAGSIPWPERSPGVGNGNPTVFFAWKIPWTEEPRGLQFMELQRLAHDWTHTRNAQQIPEGLPYVIEKLLGLLLQMWGIVMFANYTYLEMVRMKDEGLLWWPAVKTPTGLIPDQGNKILQPSWCSQKKTQIKTKMMNHLLSKFPLILG